MYLRIPQHLPRYIRAATQYISAIRHNHDFRQDSFRRHRAFQDYNQMLFSFKDHSIASSVVSHLQSVAAARRIVMSSK